MKETIDHVQLLKGVADYYEVKVKDVKSASRTSPLPESRMMFSLLMELDNQPAKYTAYLLEVDDSTVSYYLKTIKFDVKYSPARKERYKELLLLLKSS